MVSNQRLIHIFKLTIQELEDPNSYYLWSDPCGCNIGVLLRVIGLTRKDIFNDDYWGRYAKRNNITLNKDVNALLSYGIAPIDYEDIECAGRVNYYQDYNLSIVPGSNEREVFINYLKEKIRYMEIELEQRVEITNQVDAVCV